jgi:hypothetical protein
MVKYSGNKIQANNGQRPPGTGKVFLGRQHPQRIAAVREKNKKNDWVGLRATARRMIG